MFIFIFICVISAFFLGWEMIPFLKKRKKITTIDEPSGLSIPPNIGVRSFFSTEYIKRQILGFDPASDETNIMQPILDSSGAMVGLTGSSDTARRISTQHLINHHQQEVERFLTLAGETNQPIITGTQGIVDMDFASLYQPYIPMLNIIPDRIRQTPLALSEGRLNFFQNIFSKENIGINCKTHDTAKKILFIANHLGYKWNDADNSSYLDNDAWKDYKEKTCYDINEGTYGDTNDFILENCKIIDGDKLLSYQFTHGGKRQIKLKKHD